MGGSRRSERCSPVAHALSGVGSAAFSTTERRSAPSASSSTGRRCCASPSSTAAADHRLHWPKGPPPVHGASTAHTLSILSYWDGVWYRTVAEQGYLLIPGRQSDPAFFPLFPIVLRGLDGLGLSFLTSGILVANGAFVVGILAFYELSRRLLPLDVARMSAMLAALFPMSFVFSMTYPESLVFAALALALVFALDGRWTLSAIAGAAAALGRPEAIFFALPLVAIAIGR